MDEYVSKEEVLSRIYATHSTGGFANEEAYLWLHDEITNLSADVQPVKHGRWILSDDKNWLTCSFCGADVDVSCGAPFFYVDNEEVSHINFCPMCGARMDGGDING